MQTSGFAVAIPDRWRPLDLNPTALDTDLAAFLEANPNYQGMLSTQAVRSLFASGLKFYAVESRPETPVPSFPMSMSILKIDTRVELSLDAVVPATLAQLTAIADSSSPLTHRRVTLSGLDAQEFKYVAKTNTASGSPVRASATQYVVVRGTIQYVITFLSSIEFANTYAPVFEKVARSFTVP